MLRYEIKNITPPHDVLAAMEKQMRAEREKRAVILTSEGERDAAINNAEGDKQQVIKASEARRQQQINEAEGQAAAILAVAKATARRHPAGRRAHQRCRAGTKRRSCASPSSTSRSSASSRRATRLMLPANVADIASMVAMAMNMFNQQSAKGVPAKAWTKSGSDPGPAPPVARSPAYGRWLRSPPVTVVMAHLTAR